MKSHWKGAEPSRWTHSQPAYQQQHRTEDCDKRGSFRWGLDQLPDSVSSSNPYSTFPPIRFSFSPQIPSHSPPMPAHTHLAHTPRYLICGLGSQIVALWFGSRRVHSLHHTGFHKAGSLFPACFAHLSETWDGLTLGSGTSSIWKGSYATSRTCIAFLWEWHWKV